jgi:hypothetical protein
VVSLICSIGSFDFQPGMIPRYFTDQSRELALARCELGVCLRKFCVSY